jgi:D-glycero-alpha-D-manno-heptose-7-phosphate kinase
VSDESKIQNPKSKIIVRAPVRADLAGGTLDLWPLYLFHPGSRTVNVAVSYYAESEIVRTGGETIEIHLTDEGYRQRYETMQELAADPKAALIYRLLEHFHVTGISITTRTDAPRGSGLGGSSALAVTLVRGLSEMSGAPLEGDPLIGVVRDLETRLLGVPAGIQDYYPPVYGGLSALHLVPGTPVRHPISTPIENLAAHMLLHYTGGARFSGTNNWEMYKRQVEGRKKVQKGLAKIAATSVAMEKALEAGDFRGAGKALAQEWKNRKALIDGISTPEIDAAISAATGAGAWGGKVCGAGGGGCVVFLLPPENREAVVRALADVPGRVLDAMPVAHGMTVHTGDDAQSASAISRIRVPSSRVAGEVEQLYVYGPRMSTYVPHVLGEGIVTLTEPRSGAHNAVTRTYLAPIEDAAVQWHQADPIDPAKLDIRAVPDPLRRTDAEQSTETLTQIALQGEDAFRQFLAESEKLRIFGNPEFGIYSDPGETREAFIERCMEEARRRIEEQAERLESTFRRRIDQLKQKSEREEREHDGAEAGMVEEHKSVNVAWGQALYNITSGRPAAVSESAPQSMREVDYLENIAQVQRAWDRELQGIRDDTNAKALEIEEMTVAPARKNIEVTKYVILWL